MEFQGSSGLLGPGIGSFNLSPSSNPQTPSGIPEIILTGAHKIRLKFVFFINFLFYKIDTDNALPPDFADLTDIYIPDLALQLTPLDPSEIRLVYNRNKYFSHNQIVHESLTNQY